MTYFAVSITNRPDIAFEEHDGNTVRFLDASGTPVADAYGASYISRSWVPSSTASWMAPDAPQSAGERIIKTKFFLLRFTQAERVAVRTAAHSSVPVEDWLKILESDTIVHLDSSFIKEGMAAMVASGFFSQIRADTILGAAIQPFELPDA